MVVVVVVVVEAEDYVDETRGRVFQPGKGPPGWAEQALGEIQ